MFKFRRNKKTIHESDEPLSGKGFSLRSRSAPRTGRESPRRHQQTSSDHSTDGTDAPTVSVSQPSLPSHRNIRRCSSEDNRRPLVTNEDDSDDCSSYPSVGANVVVGGHRQQPQPPPPALPKNENRGLNRKNSGVVRRDDNDAKRGVDVERPKEKTQRGKKSSTNSVSQPKSQPLKHRRNNSSSNLTHQTSATVKTTQSDKTHEPSQSQIYTENAAMQQLALLVVSLKADLADLTKEKETIEMELRENRNKSCLPPSTHKDDSNVLEEYKQENLELKSDIDAFLQENDALTKEIAELKEEKEAAEDLIRRLKNDSLNGQSGGEAPAVEKEVQAATTKLKELTDENRKLEEELRLLVDEKQGLMRKHSDSMSDVALKDKEIERLNDAIHDMTEKLGQCKEQDDHASKVETLKDALKEAKERLLLADQHEKHMRQAQIEKKQQIELVGKLREDIANMTVVNEDLKSELTNSKSHISDLETELEKNQSTNKSDLKRYATEAGEYESKLQELRDELEGAENDKSEFQSELKALRELLTTVEQQKRRHQKKNNDIVVANAELKSKVDDLIIQRSSTLRELEKLKEENCQMFNDLEKVKMSEKIGSSAAVAPAASACSPETVLALQKLISNLETAKEGLNAKLAEKDAQIKSEIEKKVQLEQKLRVQEEMTAIDGVNDSELKRRLSEALSMKEETKSKLSILEDEKETLHEEVANLNCELADKEQQIAILENSINELRTNIDAKAEKLWYHEETITSLQQTKERIEADLQEASEAISLLEDELDQKESAANGANVQMTILRQKVSQLEREKGVLMKNNEELGEQIDDLTTRIKVIEMQKHVSNEEVESLREVKEKAENELHELIQSSGNQISKLQEELDESSDAIILLKEELGIVEKHIADKDATIDDLELTLKEKDASLQRLEKGGVTITSLQKLIETNEESKLKLEADLKLSSQNVHELREELKKSTSQVAELQMKLSEYDDKNGSLVEQVTELNNTNDSIKKQIHQIIVETTSTALVPRSAPLGTDLQSISQDRAKTSSLISDLKHQIQDLLLERDSALEKLEKMKKGSTATPLPPNDEDVLTESPDDHDDDMSQHTSALETKPDAEKSSIPLTIESTRRKGGTADSLTSSQPSREGSSLLEQAKSIVQEFETKRSKTSDADRDKEKLSRKTSREDSIKTMHNNINGKELEGILKYVSGDTKKSSRSKSAKSNEKFDIDQLTAIYFEKCGMSVSKLSDMSSDASSSIYRRAKPPKENTNTKKVKICRNGVSMGSYEGDLNASGQRHGFGVLICDNGNSYEGEWKNDKRDGLGIARYSSGDVYDGEWKKGKRQGHGVMYIESGDTYIGSWNKGTKHGAGTYHWADGEVDVSWYEEDRRVGQGVRWNATRNKAYELTRGTRQKEIPLDEAYKTAEKLGLNLAKTDSRAS